MKDVMRIQSQVNEDDLELIEMIKRNGNTFHNMISESVDDCKEKSIALTKLEEVVMWAVKAISINSKVDDNESV